MSTTTDKTLQLDEAETKGSEVSTELNATGTQRERETSDTSNKPWGWHCKALSILRREGKRGARSSGPSLLDECMAETFGVMFIVVFGVGAVCGAVLTEYHKGQLWHVAVMWGIGVTLAIACTASISGAHLNPAVSLAFALFRPETFSFAKMSAFWAAQYTGGVLGAAFNYMIFGGVFAHHEGTNGIDRGAMNSVETAMAFGEYFPNPGFADRVPKELVSPAMAFFVELWGTAVLMFVILAVTDPRQRMVRKEAAPVYIGFTVAVLITLYAPLTQAGWNPARDFGPRLVALMAGWGKIAIPGPRGGFWVYILGPKVGAPLGALVYDVFMYPAMRNLD